MLVNSKNQVSWYWAAFPALLASELKSILSLFNRRRYISIYGRSWITLIASSFSRNLLNCNRIKIYVANNQPRWVPAPLYAILQMYRVLYLFVVNPLAFCLWPNPRGNTTKCIEFVNDKILQYWILDPALQPSEMLLSTVRTRITESRPRTMRTFRPILIEVAHWWSFLIFCLCRVGD